MGFLDEEGIGLGGRWIKHIIGVGDEICSALNVSHKTAFYFTVNFSISIDYHTVHLFLEIRSYTA